jgi:glutamyl-tRNA synthetase
VQVKRNLLQTLLSNPREEAVKLFERYPSRRLSPNEEVTRFAPSPTGALHLGSLFTALVSERIARCSGGVFILRLEDTDKKRESLDGGTGILRALDEFGLAPDEGPRPDGTECGQYGPYVQSQRRDIYQCFVARLLQEGRAYPCFCSEGELNHLRILQERRKVTPGYYGEYAKCRTLRLDDAIALESSGKECVIRLRSSGKDEGVIELNDIVKGVIQLPENYIDSVLLKSDGLPTYHFAHVVDDRCMGTTLVARDDEWISSIPLHLELWKAMGWAAPRYAHLAPLQVVAGGSRRKLDKTKDNEADIDSYLREGVPFDAITEYLLNIANPSFEGWRANNSRLNWKAFSFTVEGLHRSGALLDSKKLDNVASKIVANLAPQQIFDALLAWSRRYSPEWEQRLSNDNAYSISLIRLGTEGRKDFSTWRGFVNSFAYFFDEIYAEGIYSFPPKLSSTDIEAALRGYLHGIDMELPKDEWWNRTAELGRTLGFAKNAGELIPGTSRGVISDFASIIRMALTKRTATPDIHDVQRVLGTQRARVRLMAAIDSIATTHSNSISDRVVDLSKRLNCWFVDHRSVGKDGVRRSLDEWRQEGRPDRTVLTLSTCLRHEFYYFASMNGLARQSRGAGYIQVQGVEAVRRLLRVCAGVDSELLGESEIMAQVEKAFSEVHNLRAEDREAFGEILSWVKDARNRTAFSTTSNYGNSAVNLVDGIVNWSSRPVVMLFGTGQVAVSIARSLSGKARRIVLVTRDRAKAEKFRREELQGVFTVAVTPSEAPRLFPLVDVLFTAIASERPIFTAEEVTAIPDDAVVVDLSYPSVFERAKEKNHFDLTNTDFSEFSSHNPDLGRKRAIMMEINKYVDQLIAILAR